MAQGCDNLRLDMSQRSSAKDGKVHHRNSGALNALKRKLATRF